MAGTYTEKVMELFKNPKNMGEMKDPDGVGEVGNPSCLVPGTILHTNDDLSRISEVAAGMRVLTHTGTFSPVIRRIEGNYHGDVLTLKNKLGTVTLTPEHIVFAVRVPKKRKYFDHAVKRTLIPGWYHASELEERDLTLFPIPKDEEGVSCIDLAVDKPAGDFKSKELPEMVPINDDFLRLCGYYLAEGDVRDSPGRTFIGFTFHVKEREYVEDVGKIVKKIFGIDVKVKEIPKRKTTRIYVYSARLARFFKRVFESGAAQKRIPAQFMRLPPNMQKALISGLWRGDGCFQLARKWPRASYSTVSRQLAQQLKLLLIRQRIVPSLYVEPAKETRGVAHREAYRIHVGDKRSLRALAGIVGVKFDYEKQEKIHSWFDGDFLYTPISDIHHSRYDGTVVNLEVDGAHSFATDSFCAHNCGDVMTVYIKVKDGRLADVKFQTFGCVAAIATSSMITELARGKTLEDGLKITREDVAKELGGLPIIKMHCSNLAADALHAAIRDYYAKTKTA